MELQRVKTELKIERLKTAKLQSTIMETENALVCFFCIFIRHIFAK